MHPDLLPPISTHTNPTSVCSVVVQLIRGATALPHGTGRDKRVAVFARGDDADAAREAGATLVGDDDLIAIVAAAKGIDADVVIATPDMMPLLGKVARILGPKCAAPPVCHSVLRGFESVVLVNCGVLQGSFRGGPCVNLGGPSRVLVM